MTGDDDAAKWRWAGRAVVLAAAVGAAAGARPFAGGWNDGSRLAAVEALGGRGTFRIDDSVFVRVPPPAAGTPSPYAEFPPALRRTGTLDKLLIGGHYYSDKSPVPTVLMAGLYRAWLAAGGPSAADRPDRFCWWLTVATSGLAYVLAVACVRQLAVVTGLDGRTVFLVALAVAAATVAPAYTRHVNAHIVLLAAAAGLCLALATAADAGTGRPRWGRIAGAGGLTGFGYTLDLGLGPPLVVAVAGYLGWVFRRPGPVAVAVLAAAPWVAAHHALNYAVGGTFGPANAVPEYLRWPGSPFDEKSMTGGLKHDPAGLVLYAADLLVGKKGFLLHNLPLLLAPGGAVLLWRGGGAARPAVGFAAAWAGLGGLAYAGTSNNLSGLCCSVRWFVPLLAPGFWVVGLALRDFPRYRPDFGWLTGCGAVLAGLMWRDGPWTPRMVPGYWGLVAVALVGWGVVRWRASRGEDRGGEPHGWSGLPVRLTRRSTSAA